MTSKSNRQKGRKSLKPIDLSTGEASAVNRVMEQLPNKIDPQKNSRALEDDPLFNKLCISRGLAATTLRALATPYATWQAKSELPIKLHPPRDWYVVLLPFSGVELVAQGLGTDDYKKTAQDLIEEFGSLRPSSLEPTTARVVSSRWTRLSIVHNFVLSLVIESPQVLAEATALAERVGIEDEQVKSLAVEVGSVAKNTTADQRAKIASPIMHSFNRLEWSLNRVGYRPERAAF